MQPAIALKSINNSEGLQKENDETPDAKEQTKVMVNCSGQWNEADLNVDLSQGMTKCPTLE